MDLRHKHWAIICIGILVAVFAALAIWYGFGSHLAFAPSNDATSTPTAATSTPAAPQHITEHAAYYDIDLAYPSDTALSGDTNTQAIASMRTAMQEIADQFKSDGNFDHLTHDDVQMIGLDRNKEALESTYTAYRGTRTVSYVFVIYVDTLGAHPNTYYRTFTFDTQTGKELALSDIFASANYLQALSTIAREKVPQIIADREQAPVSEVDMDQLLPGITPEPESFQSWYFNGRTFIVIFPPYQVGAYALGTVELPIPLSQLTDLRAAYK